MGVINVKKFGLAFGLTSLVLYSGSVLVMALTGREGTIVFFNTLLHGLDVTSIIRMDMSLAEMLIGVVQAFVMAWFVGALIASIYNFHFIKQDPDEGKEMSPLEARKKVSGQ